MQEVTSATAVQNPLEWDFFIIIVDPGRTRDDIVSGFFEEIAARKRVVKIKSLHIHKLGILIYEAQVDGS
jgi:hypothetical protein